MFQHIILTIALLFFSTLPTLKKSLKKKMSHCIDMVARFFSSSCSYGGVFRVNGDNRVFYNKPGAEEKGEISGVTSIREGNKKTFLRFLTKRP